MYKTRKKITLIGLTIAIVLTISLPTNAIIANISFKKVISKNPNNIASNIIENAHNGFEKIKKRIINRVNQIKKHYQNAELKKVVKTCKVSAKKVSICRDVSRKFLPYLLLADENDHPSINITNVSAHPKYAYQNESINITCTVTSVTSELTIDIVNVSITGPFGFTPINTSMDNISTQYYYNNSYNINGTYVYYIWAKNISTGNTTTAGPFYFYAGNWPPEILELSASPMSQKPGGSVNITCKVTEEKDPYPLDNVSRVNISITVPDGARIQKEMIPMGATGEYYFQRRYDMEGTYKYYITVTDTEGNWNKSGVNEFYIENVTVQYVHVTDDPGDENHPSSVVFDEEGNMFLLYEGEGVFGDRDIYIMRSSQNGTEWTSLGCFVVDKNQSFPQLSLIPSTKRAFSTFETEENNSGYIYVYELPDVSDENSWPEDFGFFDYSVHGLDNFSKPDITYYNGEHGIDWVIGVIGDYGQLHSIPMLVNSQPGGYGIIVSPDEPLPYKCSNISISYNPFTRNITAVCEIKENKTSDIALINGWPEYNKPDDYWYINFTIQKLNLTSSCLHPSIAVNEDGIYIATEIENVNGDYDIVCYKSSDDGATWKSYNISNVLDVSEKYPVLYANESYLYCLYYSEPGNLYLAYSIDNGKTWDKLEEKVNDREGSVVNDYQTADIADPGHIVWTDKRNGDYDIWAAVKGKEKPPKKLPKLKILDFKLEKGGDTSVLNVINISVSNTGAMNATKVRLFITCECETKDGSVTKNIMENPEYIPIIKKGETKYTRVQWFTVNLRKWIRDYLVKKFLDRGEYPPPIEYVGITSITVYLGPCAEDPMNITSRTKSCSWEEIFGWNEAKISAEPAKRGEYFNVTIYSKDGGPVSNAWVIWPTPSLLSVFYKWFIKGSFSTSDLSTLTRIGMRKVGTAYMFTTFFKEILKAKIWKLPIKFRYKLILSLLSTLFHPRRVIKIAENGLLATTLLLASSSYITDGNGKVQLMAPSLAINIPRPLIVFSYEHKCLGIEMITVED